MAPQIRQTLARFRLGLLVGLIVLALAGALLLAPASAQETPESSPQITPDATTPPATDGGASVRIEIDPPPEPVKSGEVVESRIVVDNVEHLASFEFTVQYDPDKLKPRNADETAPTPFAGTPGPGAEQDLIQIDQAGDFLATSERGNGGDGVACTSPVATDGEIKFNCSTIGAPLCLGGAAGASGSGILAVIPFESRGGGLTTIDLVDSTLIQDDVEPPCDPADLRLIQIEHTREGASIELAPKEDSSTMLIVIIAIVVLAVVAAGGAGGYWWYRQRSAGPTSS
ncbi:MAG: cohesin domain-containing protein [Dehalococcoidia bacterium]